MSTFARTFLNKQTGLSIVTGTGAPSPDLNLPQGSVYLRDDAVDNAGIYQRGVSAWFLVPSTPVEGGGPGGTTEVRATVSVTTALLAPGATESGTFTLGKAGTLLRVVTDNPAWVRLHATAAFSAADSTRLITADPTPGTGVLLEVLTIAGLLDVTLSPPVLYQNADASPSATGYYTITNRGTASTTITVTFTRIAEET